LARVNPASTPAMNAMGAAATMSGTLASVTMG
jgi:hypothetical protein